MSQFFVVFVWFCFIVHTILLSIYFFFFVIFFTWVFVSLWFSGWWISSNKCRLLPSYPFSFSLFRFPYFCRYLFFFDCLSFSCFCYYFIYIFCFSAFNTNLPLYIIRFFLLFILLDRSKVKKKKKKIRKVDRQVNKCTFWYLHELPTWNCQ